MSRSPLCLFDKEKKNLAPPPLADDAMVLDRHYAIVLPRGTPSNLEQPSFAASDLAITTPRRS